MFDTVLVANRGEIAVRVIRTLRRLGLRSVAVHSDADAGARHVREADTAIRIGPAPAAESYLSIGRLLAAARRTGAGAVHPGYGFLAENAAFARACAGAGLAFVGPPAGAIALMGDKVRAKETAAAAGVPVVPGSTGAALGDAELAAAARRLGPPVLLKPAAGGGGKGMRLVRDEAQLTEAIAAARREARGAFGDGTLLVERWIDRPRHIEIQVLADDRGRVLHLGERECSLQRRHQKIIEEAPSPLLDPDTRAAMGEAAVAVARACGYRGAGTVEFILPGGAPADHPLGRGVRPFHFLEMNTRLQVEHPVTELITGLDLVEWQLRIAAGEPLTLTQQDITLTGHAVEARICAETARADAAGRVDFLPSTGTVRLLREPSGEGVRVDSGIAEGMAVGTAYDPLLAKVTAHGPDRPTALRRLRTALAGTAVLGVETNTGFLRRLLAHPAVAAGELDTGLVDRAAAALLPPEVPDEVYAVGALLHHAALEPYGLRPAGHDAGLPAGRGEARWIDPFSVPSGWRLGDEPAWTVHWLRVPGHGPVAVSVRGLTGDAEVRVGDRAPVRARLTAAGEPGRVLLEWDGSSRTYTCAGGPGSPADEGHRIGRDGDTWWLREHDPVAAALRGAATAHGADALTAPMPGTVTVVKAAVGDQVTAGQSLLVVEAMKMEHLVTAPHDGTVAELTVAVGSTVAMDEVLAVVTPQQPDDPPGPGKSAPGKPRRAEPTPGAPAPEGAAR